MFTQSSSLGLQIAFRFGVAPPLCSEFFPAPARSSLSSSAVASKHRVLLSSDAGFPRPGRSWDTPPHRSQIGTTGRWAGLLHPRPFIMGSAGFGRPLVPVLGGRSTPTPRGLGRSRTQCLGCAIRALPECSRTTSGCKATLFQSQPAPRAVDGALRGLNPTDAVPRTQASERFWGLPLGPPPPQHSLVSFHSKDSGGGGTQPSHSLFLLANPGDKGGGSSATRKA